jgi:hypothetical protein
LIGKITLKAGLHQGYLVPEDVVIQTQNKAFLRVVDGGVAKKIPVTLGSYVRGRVEIVQGLSEGMKVVERASGYVGDGDQVKVEESQEAAVN